MAFVCPPKEESEDKTKLLCKLKKVVKEIEDGLSIQVKPICVPCCVPVCNLPCCPPMCSKPCCPATCKKPSENGDKETTNFNPPDIMVCYKLPLAKDAGGDVNNNESGVFRLKQSKSRELRASILYTGCDCEKRDGLQDDCPRTGCHGSPECLTKPPTCGPSEFCDGKHLGKKNNYNSKKSHAKNNTQGNGNNAKTQYTCFPAVLKPPVCYVSCVCKES